MNLALLLAGEPVGGVSPTPTGTFNGTLDGIHQILIALIALIAALTPIFKTIMEARGHAKGAAEVVVIADKLTKTTKALDSTILAVEAKDMDGTVKAAAATFSEAKGVGEFLNARVKTVTNGSPDGTVPPGVGGSGGPDDAATDTSTPSAGSSGPSGPAP